MRSGAAAAHQRRGQPLFTLLTDEPERFDRAEKHDHLVCERCGRLADVSFDDLTASLRAQLGEDFSYYDLKVYYLCPQCRAEQCKTDEKGECE